MSVGAVNKSTGDRIPTAGMPAIDSVLSGTSTNPVQNAIITAALALKQNATDNNLETTSKTVVGAVNELKSGLTNVHDGFKDAIGWDNHKNLFDKNATDTSNGFVPNAGLGSDNSTSSTDTANVSEYIPVTAGVTYTLQGLIGNHSAICFYNSEKTYIIGYTYQNQSVKTVTAPANSAYARFTVNKANIDITQMEVGSTATSYEPYHPVIGPAVEDLQSGLTDVNNNLTGIINQVGGIYVFRRNTSSSSVSAAFTYTGTRYAGLFFNISNSGKCSVYAVTYNNSGTTKSYLEKLAGDTLGSLVINNDNGNISVDMANWSSCILIVSDNNFTVS